ncbi:MAG TPA: asparagine synthase-related protein [Actinomycetota bacterium]|nr:asparagine synthase-related protein [Actinomycetota bacterium]
MSRNLNPLGLTPLEIGSNRIHGADASAPNPARGITGRTPRAALEDAVAGALARPPCGVSFSGGRDSSAVLATAAHVARREGLPLPIPLTLRFPDVPETDETAWQEKVIRHLGLTHWERIEIGDELDIVGPVARRVLARCGLLWPANTYVHEPLLERVAGGSLLTGVDGDGLLAGWRWQHQADVLARRKPRRSFEALRIAHAASPRSIRRIVARRRDLDPPQWLQPDAARAVAEAELQDLAEEPFRWSKRVRWYARRRYLHLTRRSFELMADAHRTRVSHLFLDPQFLAQLARDGAFGPGDRTTAMTRIFGDLLPADVLARATKARFGRAFRGRHTEELLSRWDGRGVDTDVVRLDVVERMWRHGEDPKWQTGILFQSMLLRLAGDGA